ncbi:MAG: bestrophin family ion channel [Nitrosomonas sp.]|nr:bestrophin family ion channel [Nitrosomonas sp.]MDP1787843.1 bestrophin family ion channel [Nitrosomonas sp.]MDP2224078.1 bestrophin family ion channel [Nitrosomonas sp.]MDP3664620.1 bestrophin family ion channel [Nitrosomonas sp.]MDZ4107830.1 bestrophin family ion channel [Nitrosomonas sp.]
MRLLFHFRGSSFMETWPRILTVTFAAMIVTYVELYYNVQAYTLTTTPFLLIGVALGIFLGFRNNVSYDKFWEGRKLWGALVNTSRNLARQVCFLIDASHDSEDVQQFRELFVKHVIAYGHALRCHLRNEDPAEQIKHFLSVEDLATVLESTHRPLTILHQLGRDLAVARDRHWLHELNFPFMDAQLNELSNILGGCERIKNTPIPFSYSVLIHRIVASYCLFLPFGLVETTGVLTPIVVLLISYAFFELDAIGDEIENPFGLQPNDLPLTAISRNIEINLLELINDPNRPEALKPENDILL